MSRTADNRRSSSRLTALPNEQWSVVRLAQSILTWAGLSLLAVPVIAQTGSDTPQSDGPQLEQTDKEKSDLDKKVEEQIRKSQEALQKREDKPPKTTRPEVPPAVSGPATPDPTESVEPLPQLDENSARYAVEMELFNNDVPSYRLEERRIWAVGILRDFKPGTELVQKANEVLYEVAVELYRDEVSQWIIPRQREWAAAIMLQYPGTELAERMRLVLNELAEFDKARTRRTAIAQRRSELVRGYWSGHHAQWSQARRAQEELERRQGIHLTNRSQLQVFYQMRAANQRWSNIVPLAPGATHRFVRPVEIRYPGATIDGRLMQMSLQPGQSYAVQKSSRDTPLEIHVESR